ncbi:biofilm formation regulator HmsP [Raoultella ornithinolytica]|uniref:biofilm formation regulator HmsP n=1 Tax=Raoultella ornithinolytica TaxID=54291 RepID=UPI001265AEFD|nr:biofilm formation regulator HmsP [Raoultella ornithinolytica]EKQ7999820.1 biofilm formation regulator HmsP [Raoultella ornithinolytica]EKU0198525.1 biofilm formation regulator HmsP [Raoultella ornithinolytica]EKV4098874.1 biofilm formation regulator HmsP [Raoultella ornithinolytica]EKV8285632.1 biofilm formation regulator HmsP [Raoultella ornithinolytica]EKW3194130.1 biofilm formation regulator HmsP [Raoultella ornithinolytica]
MRVSRSLTIKQMAMVAGVSMAFVLVFCSILLFHFVQQSRFITATQLESIARSVREPLSAAILKADIPEAEAILGRIQPAGIVSRADVVLPNQFQALRMRFIPERPVPVMVTRVFELPVQISLPIYSLERPANPQPIAYLVLQADSWQTYKFVMSILSTLVTAYFLLVLILTVAITWCINRLIVRPLRKLARELNDVAPQDRLGHQLTLPRLHHDDEIGLLVRSYNRNQQTLLRQHDELTLQSTRFPVSELPNKAFLMALLEQTVARPQSSALLVIACETLQDTAGVLKETQREILLLTLVEKLRGIIPPRMVLAQISGYDFAILAHGMSEPWHAVTLSKQVLTVINERLPLQGIQLRPCASVGIAMFNGELSAEQLYRRAFSAAIAARHKGKNQIEFFDPAQMEKAQRRLMEEHDILTALDNHQFAIWLQPQVDAASGEVCGAEVLLRQRQPDGSWSLPTDLIERIEACGLMVPVGYWVMEEACRQLAAWQSLGIMLPLSVNVSLLQLLHHDRGTEMLTLLDRYRIAPGTLVLEITESRHLDDPQTVVSLLRPLREAGVRIALDDFGMGYAGLRQLQHMKSLPVDILKIDKAFIDMLPEDTSMVPAIIQLARGLNLRIVAEGVEKEAQYHWLQAAGVDVVQGFLFGCALSQEAFMTQFLRGKNEGGASL